MFMLANGQELIAQKRLDSVVKYAYSGVGNDSIAIAKRMFDYNSNGQLTAERKLSTSDYIHWINDLRLRYSYDGNGRLKEIRKDSFLVASSTWKDYAYRERVYSNDSSFHVRFFERNKTGFHQILQRTRVFLFKNGELKSRVKLADKNADGKLELIKRDSFVKNYHKDFIKTYYKWDFLHSSVEHYSKPNHHFFHLDSTVHIYSNRSTDRYRRLASSSSKRVVFVNQHRALTRSRFITSDSIIYFLNNEGLPDSAQHHRVYWQNPTANKILEKFLYTWRGYNLESISKLEQKLSSKFEVTEKTEFENSKGILAQDTIFYKMNGTALDKHKKVSNRFGLKGAKLSRTEYRWSSLVDSFSLHEKEIFFYSDPATSIPSHQKLSHNVYPNPSSGIIHLEGEAETEWILYNTQGKELRKLSPLNSTVFIKEKGLFLLRELHSGSTVKILIE